MAGIVTTVTANGRLSEERLPGEPGTSTDGERPRPTDSTAATQGHDYRSNSRQPLQSTQEPVRQLQGQQQQAATTSTAAADGTMITVAASRSRAPKSKPRSRLPPSSSTTLFPVEVTDRLRSSNVSSLRPRQYGRRRSVQEAIISAVALQQQQQQLQSLVAIPPEAADITLASSNTAAAVNYDPLQEQEPPSRLVATLRLVHISRFLFLFDFTIVKKNRSLFHSSVHNKPVAFS